ncbi:hypothetical protein BP6252_08595 [Coleophoma cylindrospora]|uniref:Uncharacterized protein n=1 Tax=Coleophoma cylindrospora TaxID=1849047 RepID=A0A3D8R6A6_9HELO|nr:hypothetical protein BP6252_08595 [Coleophoma cylindrospora]
MSFDLYDLPKRIIVHDDSVNLASENCTVSQDGLPYECPDYRPAQPAHVAAGPAKHGMCENAPEPGHVAAGQAKHEEERVVAGDAMAVDDAAEPAGNQPSELHPDFFVALRGFLSQETSIQITQAIVIKCFINILSDRLKAQASPSPILVGRHVARSPCGAVLSFLSPQPVVIPPNSHLAQLQDLKDYEDQVERLWEEISSFPPPVAVEMDERLHVLQEKLHDILNAEELKRFYCMMSSQVIKAKVRHAELA